MRRNRNKTEANVPAPKSVQMGEIGYKHPASHCGKPNVRRIIGQPDAFYAGELIYNAGYKIPRYNLSHRVERN